MAYGPEWDPNRVKEVKDQAEAQWNGCDTMNGFLYRFDDTSYSVVIDADREEYGSTTKLELYAYPVVKNTPCGVRILVSGPICGNQTRWISSRSKKQFACLTLREAKTSYIVRRQKQAEIYEAKAKKARYLAALAKVQPGCGMLGIDTADTMSPEAKGWRERALNAERTVKKLNDQLTNASWEREAHQQDAQRRRDAEIGRMGGGG